MNDELQRSLMRAAGYRCVLPSCRSIEAAARVVNGEWFALCEPCRERAAAGELGIEFLRRASADLGEAHERFSQFEIDMLFRLARHPDGQGEQWPGYLYMLVTRLVEAGLARVVETGGSVYINGMKSNPDLLCITPRGRAWIESIGRRASS